MRNLALIIVSLLLLAGLQTHAQSWQTIEEGQTLNVNGLQISFITSYIKEVKGQDVYTITATVSNNGADVLHLYSQARYSFIQEPNNAWAHFRFTNATGKGLSSREGYIYPNPLRMSFPYKCDKDAKNDTWEDRVIGVGLYSGQYKTKEWRVRVDKGDKPTVMVFVKVN